MDKGTALTLAKQYASIVSRELNPDKIVLYGSHVHGTATDESDIDVAVIFDKFDGDWLTTYTRISKLRRSVSSYIEPVLLDGANDNSGFVDEVLATGEMLYAQ
jgi:predicted nucleotidyltransferase